MKQKQIALIILFMALLFLPYPSWKAVQGHLSDENNENRVLAEFPVPNRANFETWPSAFSQYVNDRMPYRTRLIRTQSRLDYHLFDRSFDDQVVVGKNNFLFHQAEKPFHRGNSGFDEEQLENIARNLTEAKENLAAEGIDFYLFIAPNKETIYPENFPEEILTTGGMNRTEQLIPAKEALEKDFNFLVQDGMNHGVLNGEMINRQFDKGRGVRIMAEALGFDIADTIGFGDSMNDLEMIETVGVSVCMDNGSPLLKSKSSMVCPAVDADGLAWAFDRLGLCGE